MSAPATITAEADTLDLPCGACGNATSAVAATPTEGTCAYCLTQRVRELQARWQNRYRRTDRWL